MRFQTRLLLTYSFIIVLLVIALGIGFYGYSAGVFERSARANLGSASLRMARQLDDLVRPMNFVATYLLSDGDFYSSIESLAYLDKGKPGDLYYVNEGWRQIKRTLLSYSIGRDFHSVNFFNRSGDFLSSNLEDFAGTSDARPLLAAVPWLERADAARGKPVLVAPFADPWRPRGSGELKVYALARAIQGASGAIGYIEVQNSVSDLESLFSVSADDGVRCFAFLSDGSLFFSSSPPSPRSLARYAELAAAPGEAALSRDPESSREEIVAAAEAGQAGASVVLVQDRGLLLRPLAFTRNLTLVVGLLIILASLAYNYLFSRQLTKPILRLKAQMEGTEIENLPDELAVEAASHPLIGQAGDEIDALARAFADLRARLHDSINRELVAQSLQSRARFDSLQAQVSPHFIYNVLTVIANKGLEAGSEEIGEICSRVADMLRYSTATTAMSATLETELEHLRSYLYLMQKRLENRLEFSIAAEPSLLGERTPKIVLQQLAENSINHGYDAAHRRLSIDIRLFERDGRWRIELSDDGAGFAHATLAELEGKIAATGRSHACSGGSSIGGMGLVNLYSRLMLYYGGDFDFELGDRPGGGALVALGAPLGSGKED
jgi:Predicted signal transduction protein with a C-terminal ATPase domain